MALRVSIEHNELIDGLVLESPMLQLNDNINGLWGKRTASAFLTFIIPTVRFNLGIQVFPLLPQITNGFQMLPKTFTHKT